MADESGDWLAAHSMCGGGGRITDSNLNPRFQPQWRCSRPTSKDSVKERLTRYRQIKIRVIGRKFGRTISIPVWFVLDGEKLYLLPMQGSENNGSRTYFRTRRFGLMCELSKFDVAVGVELR